MPRHDRPFIGVPCHGRMIDAKFVREPVGVLAQECVRGCGGACTGVLRACWRACGSVGVWCVRVGVCVCACGVACVRVCMWRA
eukprot:5628512-Pleurochrysis_carterae.AAC.7